MSGVMAGLVPAIHVLLATAFLDVDALDKPGHDQKYCKSFIGYRYFFAGAFAASGLAAASSALSSRSTLAACRSLAT